MKDVIKQHRAACPNFHQVLDLSMDGIQECKSSALSADVYSVSFKGCRTVYPVKIVRPINKFKINDQEQIREVVDDINNNNCTVNTVIADNLKRSVIRCALSFGASYPCEYCEEKAIYIYNTDSAGKKTKKGHLAWPSSTANGTPRTIEKIVNITNQIEEGIELSRDERKGFYGTSVFLHQPNFDFIVCIPAEYMHSGCIGVVKRILELTFNVGENRERVTKRKLSDASTYNRLIILVQVPREFNRRFRNLDFGVLKAQEFRNIILFFYPIVLSCIPDEFTKEKKTWLQLTYIMRACILPNEEFEQIPDHVIKTISTSFYKNFESLYGKKICSYSIHMIGNHILDIKGEEPLTSKSAFKYEDFYAEVRNLFQPGTIAPSKQILKDCYMKRYLENHNCEKSIFYDIEKSGKENNSLVYIFDENKKYNFYNIIEKIDDNNFLCNAQGRFIYKSDVLKDVDWEKVGVFKIGPYSNETFTIKRKQIHGKVLKVDQFFITCPNNVLREK